MNTTSLFFAVFIGGGLGAVSRFIIDKEVMKLVGVTSFPLGILVCNVLGSFLIGVLSVYCSSKQIFAPLVITGFLGAFTTFSTFSLNTVNLMQGGKMEWALLNIILSVGLSLSGLYVGLKLGKAFVT